MSEGPEWFAPKRYGYGAGLPITWQGWAIVLGYAGLVLLAGVSFRDHPRQLLAVIVPLTVTLVVICARTTRGGWRWRWGEEE